MMLMSKAGLSLVLLGFMPFAPDLGLVVEEDGVPIRLQAHGVAFEVEVKLGKGNDMVFGPSGLGHVMQ